MLLVDTPRVFAPNASIVLVGIRGCGKTSLGYIAAMARGWRLVEADDEFERIAGLSRAQFLKTKGKDGPAYQMQERLVMESILANYERDAVIICGIGSIESHGQMLLKQYARSHPVIHIVREREYVSEWLQIPKESNIVQHLEESDRKHRLCSNFDSARGILDGPFSRDPLSGQRSPPGVGILQRTQRDFLKFVNFVMGCSDASLQALRSKINAAAASSLNGVYTYALSVRFSQIDSIESDIINLENGADAVELEVDASDIVGQSLTPTTSTWITKLSRQIAVLRRKIAAPIIYHVDRNSFIEPQTESPASQDDVYLKLLHIGLRLGAEFVTVDIDSTEQSVRQVIDAKGSTAIIGDHFDIDLNQQGWNGPRRSERYQRATELLCDIVRMRQFATSIEDNITVREFSRRLTSPRLGRSPLIAYNVGRLGRVSMCLNTILTGEASKLTHDLGVLDPLHFCIFGASVFYSLSPAMHNAAYRVTGLPHEYKVRESSNIQDLDALLHEPSFGGASVSLPFKMDIIKRMDSVSAEGQAIGAVNTIIPVRRSAGDRSKNQKSRPDQMVGWHGDNTDWIGITTCVKRNLSPANVIQPWTTGLVLGAGGMARAAIYALIRLGVPNIFVCNRTVSRAEDLAAYFAEMVLGLKSTLHPSGSRNVKHRLSVIESIKDPWPADFNHPTIIVSCIPAHSINGLPAANITLPVPWLQSFNGGVVIELAYRPLVTPLLAQIERLREAGRPWAVVSGLEVLPEQCIAQFQLMTGRTAPRHTIRAEVLRSYQEQEDNQVEETAQT
ncbi:type I 3-dehydroquinase-domain-containing protein [Phaeosphaeriaceae sp. PMI808]|nr:type I 3-dehydroquinase-domain-containing protein [Phaeosphaeriaceae sp. PMI808]